MSRPNFERLAPAPRAVPLGVRLQALFGGYGILGWVLVAALSPFAWLFAGNADVLSPLLFSTDVEVVDGRVTGVKETSASEGRRRVYEVAYDYRVPSGAHLTGTSYTTGGSHSVGDVVHVEYLSLKPDTSRIAGARMTIFGPAAVVSLIFPAIGVVVAGLGLRSGLKRLHLLRDGQLASAAFVKQEPTNVRINNRPLLELTFEYKSADGVARTFTQRTTEAGALTDERREQVLYLSEAPERATLVDALPRQVAVDERGEIVSGGGAALVLLPVLLALAVNGALAACRFAG